MQISPEQVVVLDSDNDEVFKQELEPIVISSDEEEIVISDSESDNSSMLLSPVTIATRGEQTELVKPVVSPSSKGVEGAQHLEDCHQTLPLNNSPQGSGCDNLVPLVCSKHNEITDKQYCSASPRLETNGTKSLVKIQRKLVMPPIAQERLGQFVPLERSLRNEGSTLEPVSPTPHTVHHPESCDTITGSDSVMTPPCKKMKPTTISDSSYNNNTSPVIEYAHQFADPAATTPQPIADTQQDTMVDTLTPTSIRKVFRKRKLLKPTSLSGQNFSRNYACTTAADQSLESSVDFRVKTEAQSPRKEDTGFVPTGFLSELGNDPSSTNIHHSCSLSDSGLSVKEEPKSPVKLVRASESDAPRRKRKLCKSMDLYSEVPGTAVSSKTSPDIPPLYIDCDFVTSHTQDNSPLRFSFIAQLQTEGYALPHQMISDLVQDMIKAEASSTSNAICKILWSDSECFPHSTKKLLDDLFTMIIDSLMANKYSCVKNINMALQYFLNILCVNWRNTTNESDSYVATFLQAKVRQLLSELRRYYDKPVEMFCPHIAATLQQLTCLSLAVIHEPQRLSEFSQQVYDEVFSPLSSDKQEVFLNNLPSPYLVARLSATLLAADYVPVESRDLLPRHDEITTDWVSRFLMVCKPYHVDGTIALRYVLWLLTKLLTSHLQYKNGMILSSPIIVFHPLALLEMFDLSYCNELLEDFMSRLVSDDVLYVTCLFTPEVNHYLKLISTLLEDKMLPEPDQST